MISIVDDDQAVREAIQKLVRSMGYDVCTFASAEEFFESSRMHDASCVITDVHMPGLNGIEFQDRLLAKGNRVPIIFITAYPEESLRIRAMKSGAVCFMSKPFSDEALVGCIDRALNAP